MKRIVVTLVVLVVLGIGLVSFFISAPPKEGEPLTGDGAPSAAPLKVVTTTGMLADAARRVGGAAVEVVSLMGPGIDPHLYKASAGDVQKMSSAGLLVLNGLHLEGKMGEVVGEMQHRSIPTIAVGDKIDKSTLLEVSDYGNSHDPHIWFDVQLWAQAVRVLSDEIIRLRPVHADAIAQATEAYLGQLQQLHQSVLSRAAQVPAEQRVLVTAHDAFGYFARAYHFEVHGIQGVSTAAEAGARDVQRLATMIAERKIRAIFVESSVPPRLVEALQAAVRDRGFEVSIGGELYGDAMGPAGSGADNYLGMVRHNIDTIAGALAPAAGSVAQGDK